MPVVRNLGTIFLAAGFIMLAVAVLIRDPHALDANIGAGILMIVGIPLGAVGLALEAAYALAAPRDRRRRGRVQDWSHG